VGHRMLAVLDENVFRRIAIPPPAWVHVAHRDLLQGQDMRFTQLARSGLDQISDVVELRYAVAGLKLRLSPRLAQNRPRF